MRILILDDMQTRHDRFAAIFSGHTVFHCKTLVEFVNALSTGPFDLVCLDHDLNDAPGVDNTVTDMYGSKELTGLDAAHILVKRGCVPSRAIVHSLNAAGAARICAVLAEAGCNVRAIPFSM